jgi:DnaJ-class molecular chaperone
VKSTKTTTMYVPCPECNGTGRKDLFGYQREVQLCCFLCSGSGRVVKSIIVEEVVLDED